MLILTLLFLVVVNIPLIWILVGLFSVIIFVYSISIQHTGAHIVEGAERKKRFPFMALFIVFISIFFLIGGSSTKGIFAKYISIPNMDVRPTVTTTIQIATKSLKHNVLLGTGPNTFSSDWSLWHPKEISQTIFWNINFSNGYSFLLTILATTGILGFLSFIFFIFILLIRGYQSLKISLKNPLSNYFIITTFIISAYSWIMIIVYNPNILIMLLAFTSSGMLIGILVHKKIIPVREYAFLDDPRSSFFSILALMILMIGALSLTYIYSKKFASVLYFSKSLTSEPTITSLVKSEGLVLNSLRLNKNDIFYRNLSQIYLNEINLLVKDKKISSDNLKINIERLISLIGSASNSAIKQNPKQYLNYMNLGNIYSSLNSLGVKNSYENAVLSYNKAITLAPSNPSVLLARAQIEFLNKKNNQAKEYIKQALALKINYTDAYFLLAEIDTSEGSVDKAIKQIEIAGQMNPRDSTIFFRLGTIRYSSSDFKGAVSAFERAVVLNPQYLQARYFLAKSYEKINRKEDALVQYKILKKLLPNNKDVENSLKLLSNIITTTTPSLNENTVNTTDQGSVVKTEIIKQ